ncbi:hypothetical protein [uncultured Methanobrevibacter sp.]|uniref:hypothetical protein n=1 Tax=uncultured Methanobrevibacter sp. TaxID=253161 RepID=UPI0025DF9B8C|nr:hypothetical protein [uncultured Methanobrevibacter sp.]
MSSQNNNQINLELFNFKAERCRIMEDTLNFHLKELQDIAVKEFTPIIGKKVRVTYYTKDSYKIKHGENVAEFSGIFEGFTRNGLLHIVNSDNYWEAESCNIRPLRITNIVVWD